MNLNANTNTDYLKSIAEEITANHEPQNEPAKPNQHLLTEAQRLEKIIIYNADKFDNISQRNTFHLATLNKLVHICDQLFDNSGPSNPNVSVLTELITAIKQITGEEIRPGLKLPKAFIAQQKHRLSGMWAHHLQIMQTNKINDKLTAIAYIPFQRFIEASQALYWGDYSWLKGYQAKLDIMDLEHADCNSKAEALISLLIGRDFNDDRFYIYCKKYIQERTKQLTGKRKKLLEFAQCEKLVLQDTQIGMPSYDVHANTISVRLVKWIREEIEFVETYERDVPISKFAFKWNVETIAFFFKLLWDHKVFGKVSLEPLSEQIAANCSSVGKDEFQPTTIFSRFYVKDVEVLMAVEKLLREMLEDVGRFLR